MMQQTARKNKLSRIGKAGLKNYLFDGQTNTDSVQASKIGTVKSRDVSKTITDLFPVTTIMFGDIAG